jgi:hypothetical protein
MGPQRPLPPGPRPSFARRRLIVVAVIVTIAAAVYFGATSLGGGGGSGGGAATSDPYLRANSAISTEAQSILTAGNDLRTLRNVGVFANSVNQSIASIGAQVTLLTQLANRQKGSRLSVVQATAASGEHLSQLAATFSHDVTKGNLGPANRDEASIQAEIANLQQQATQWKKAS